MTAGAKKILSALLTSKKFVGAALTAVAVVLVHVLVRLAGMEPDAAGALAEQLSQLLLIIGTVYVGAQGVADHGKEAAKAKADAGRIR